MGAPIGTTTKLSYYGFIASAIARAATTKNLRVRYLGSTLHYDNFATPLTLQLYPHEISQNILANVSPLKISKVLDIGGNIGQFSLTLSHALDNKVKIDVLEPNPVAFELLQKNTSAKPNIKVYNVGVGATDSLYMYYTPGKSGTGSVFRANTSKAKLAKKIKIKLVNNISTLTGQKEYDLIKIDVEGYEYSLLEAIKPLRTKYLFMEVSLNRYKNFSHSQLFGLIEDKFGKFDIVHLSAADAGTNNFDILLKF